MSMCFFTLTSEKLSGETLHLVSTSWSSLLCSHHSRPRNSSSNYLRRMKLFFSLVAKALQKIPLSLQLSILLRLPCLFLHPHVVPDEDIGGHWASAPYVPGLWVLWRFPPPPLPTSNNRFCISQKLRKRPSSSRRPLDSAPKAQPLRPIP